ADGRPGESQRGRGTGQGEDQGRNGKAFGKSEESHERQEIRRASALMGKANEKQLRGDWAMRLPANLGMMLLAIWLIAEGAVHLLNISLPESGRLLNVLAIVAGILLLLKR